MAPPKKQSGFMLFVTQWRKNTAEGRNMSIPQAVARCGVKWQKLTAEQRLPFITEAKSVNGQGSANKERQKADQVERDLAEEVLQMKRSIEGLVMNGKKSHDLENSKFVFCAFNFFTQLLNSDVYVPAEFAASQWSLKDGIISMFHTLIDPGALTMGQCRDAQEHSKATHNLPLPPKALGESSMEKLLSQIVGYLTQCQSSRPIVVFTTTEMMPVVKSCFRYLACEAKEDSRNGALHRIMVFDMQYLLYVLKREVLDVAGLPNDKITTNVTDTFFLRDFFEFTNGIACDFHEEIDRAKYCAQSMVMRWCYTFCDYMCGDLGINIVPGRHIPSNAKPHDSVLSAATSRVSLLRESSFDSFHSMQSLKSLPGTEANNPRRRDSSPTSSRRSSACSTVYSSRGKRRRTGLGTARDPAAHSSRSRKDFTDDDYDFDD